MNGRAALWKSVLTVLTVLRGGRVAEIPRIEPKRVFSVTRYGYRLERDLAARMNVDTRVERVDQSKPPLVAASKVTDQSDLACALVSSAHL